MNDHIYPRQVWIFEHELLFLIMRTSLLSISNPK